MSKRKCRMRTPARAGGWQRPDRGSQHDGDGFALLRARAGNVIAHPRRRRSLSLSAAKAGPG
eukprot:CAMPEP_0202115232 /NCGR_PEP_ID=MMETSP0965-20130614/37947_1 /ASSEMBLY_ACC=CAM_ASM_000507 /TAXON_ID=4773 /ORGANISM="Schizochytrium aggregatum, Strain ATCC28209" /LENGTH=61 /DNA_ID=CAMNT_0048685015 /DNA_START=18 /DNA_END=199 /DNA_ORIENTATION=+